MHPNQFGTHEQFQQFYNNALYLLNYFYLERTITLSSRDPEFVIPAIKASLRRKNRLMRAGRIEKANELAALIGKQIVLRSKTRLCKVDGKTDSKVCGQRCVSSPVESSKIRRLTV